MAESHITPDLFKFLKDLKKHNSRAWFTENKDRYEKVVRDPLLRFISDFGPLLKKISRHYVADPRPMGGSLFRIYRDVRFSPDKSPYKTHAGVQFRHMHGKDVHAPGFYLHLEPGSVFGAVGLWRPDPPSLAKIRDTIAHYSDKWKKAVSDKSFRTKYTIEGESLQRPPKGYDPAHPFIEDIKRKDFIGTVEFSEKIATSPGFLEHYAETCKAATPYMKFLVEAVDLTW